MANFLQTIATSLLVWVGLVFWMAVKSELIPEIKMMGWWSDRKWFWISVIVAFYIALIILLVYIWASDWFISMAK